MRKTKAQKGITLVALIITIIVLLILAVVAIGAITNDGIINHAKNARQEYGAAQDNESALLANYLEKINANAPQIGNGGETPGGSGNTGGNQGTIITFTIDGKQYQVEAKMKWKQWCEGREDYYVSEETGMVMCRGSENKGVYCSKCDFQIAGNMPVEHCVNCGSSDNLTHVPAEPETETITFYYNGSELKANKGTTWENWPEYSMAGLNQVDGGYLTWSDENLLCYEDGTWVKADEEIRDEYHYTKGLAFSVGSVEYYAAKGQTWESWINAVGRAVDFGTTVVGYPVFSSNALTYEDGTWVKLEDEIRPGYSYKIFID